MDGEAHIAASGKAPDVIALMETRPKNRKGDWNQVLFTIPGYNMECINNTTDIGRGMVMYLQSNLNYSLQDIDQQGYTEAHVVEVKLDRGQKVVIASVYRSPNSSPENNQQLNTLIRQIGAQPSDFKIILGDFNFPKINWTTLNNGSQNVDKEFLFIEATRDAFLTQHVDKPTRMRGENEPSLLDLVFTDETQATPEIDHCAPLGPSDHALLKVTFDLDQQGQKANKDRLNYSRGNYERMKEVLTIDWMELLGDLTKPEEMWNKFKAEILKAANRCIPKMKIKKGHTKRIPVDKKTLSKIRRKKRLWLQTRNNRSRQLYQEYCQIRNQVRRATRRNIYNKEKEIATQIKTNPKRFWNYTRQRTGYREVVPQLEIPGGGTTADDKEKAEVLSTFFKSVFTEEMDGDWDLPRPVTCNIDPDMTIIEDQVLHELEKLDPSKSPGPDEIHPKILYETRTIIAYPLSLIFNASLQEGRIPEDWKSANITPIHKKGDKKQPNNYHPVSLTSVCCKMMERILRKHIMDYMETNNLLSKRQYGFISGRSTLLQLLTVMDKWTEEIDKGHEVDVIFLDFKKAFQDFKISRFYFFQIKKNQKKSTKCNKYTILEKTNGYRQDAKVAYSVR